jgi:hypothetical protein
MNIRIVKDSEMDMNMALDKGADTDLDTETDKEMNTGTNLDRDMDMDIDTRRWTRTQKPYWTIFHGQNNITFLKSFLCCYDISRHSESYSSGNLRNSVKAKKFRKNSNYRDISLIHFRGHHHSDRLLNPPLSRVEW